MLCDVMCCDVHRFGDNERALANMLASIANPIGIALANVLGPAIVNDESDMPTM